MKLRAQRAIRYKGGMKSFFVICGLAFFAHVLTAGPIHTAVIPTGGTTLTLTINSGRLLKIYDFVHDGSNAGTAALTKNSQTGTIMQSIAVASPEVHRTFLVAGPATVAIAPATSGTLTITYQFVDNTD